MKESNLIFCARLFIVIAISTCISSKVFSQGEIPVDMYTGTPSIEIPVANITSHDLSDRISLVYNAKGVRVAEASGPFGMGWSLNTGGSIRREVRGLPDDYTGTTSNDQRRGWLYLKGATGVNAAAATLPNAADNSASTCTDETSDFSALMTYRGTSLLYDTEPDIFHLDIPGFSGTFVFDNSATPQIRLMPHQELKIEPVFVSGSKKIDKFLITTNTGITYQFYEASFESRKTTWYTDEVDIEFLRSEYQLYNSSVLLTDATYNTSWHLTKIESPSGDWLQYVYNSETFDETDTVKVNVRKGFNINDYVMDNVYLDRRWGTRKTLGSLGSAAGPNALLQKSASGMVTSIQVTDSRLGIGGPQVIVKTVKMSYYEIAPRSYLLSMKDSAAGFTHPPYKFYYGSLQNISMTSKSQDFWGYYNARPNSTLAPKIYVYPQLPQSQRYRLHPIPGYAGENYVIDGADRTANPAALDACTLKGITYPWGGKTDIVYEPNTYRDEVANVDQYGGGLRIKSFTYMDGLNPDARITKTFTYTDDAGNSSGRIIKEPVFVIPTWEYRDPLTTSESSYYVLSEDMPTLWSALTVRSRDDLSSGELTHGSYVGYTQVKVSRPGSGYAKFEFTLPAASGASAVGDWSPTNNTFARSSPSCPAMNVIAAGSRDMYPYAPDPNYDYERGLVWRKREYNEQNVLVRKTETTYQYLYKEGTAPVKVWGFKFEKYPDSDEDIYLFGKYFLLTDVAKVIASETVTTYDAADAAKNNADVTQYFYESAAHKLLSRVSQTQPDGTIYTSRMKYPLDYGTIPSGSDATSQVIGTLQTSFRNGVPIETYTTVNRNGAGEKVINGSVVMLNSFSNKILPEHQLSWNRASSRALGSFTPSYVDGVTKTFKTDSAYEKVTTFLAYDVYGKPKSVTDQGRNTVNTVWGHLASVPVVTLANAALNQAAFANFESGAAPLSFTVTSTISDDTTKYYGAGHTGARGISPSIKMTATLNKGASAYRLSGWWNKANATMQVQVIIKAANNPGTIYFNQTYTITPAESSFEWEYFEKEIPIDPALTADFKVEINFGAFTGSLRVDDIGFVPIHATLSTFTYQIPFGPTSSLTGNKGTISEYDPLGRLKYVMDPYRNILQRIKHEFTNNN